MSLSTHLLSLELTRLTLLTTMEVSINIAVNSVHLPIGHSFKFVSSCAYFFFSLVNDVGETDYLLYLDTDKGYFVAYECIEDTNAGTHRGMLIN